MTPNKACPVVVRAAPAGLEILMFRHPRAGCQLVKGSIEPGESAPDAALRELFEEAGITDARVIGDLGLWEAVAGEQVWSFQRCEPGAPLPDRWSHPCADDGGHIFELFWQPLAEDPRDAHPVFLNAVRAVRARL
jgi:8-oxo-dGTP pyrophosphatase MutT (NUDIX family)